MTQGTFRYGTSSWSEKSWDGVFYPARTPAGEQLPFYATQFDTVEADVTYYRIPDRRMVEGWRQKTPAGFLLAAKFPGAITHGGTSQTPDPSRLLLHDVVGAEVDRFLEVMDLLGDRAGPLVLQFPYFNKKAFVGAEPFLERLDRFLSPLPDRFRYAVEVRNKNWIAPPLLQLLSRHRVALVLVDLLYMPHPAELAETQDVVTTDFVYMRLIGDRKAVEAKTSTFDRIVVDQEERLSRFAVLIKNLLGRVPEVFAYANNHYAGHGPATIRRLAELVRA